MKLFKSLFGAAAVGALCLAATACSGKTTVKIGVLVSDDTGSEALAFRSYYEDYVAKNYNVKFIYSDKTDSAEKEASAIDNFIASNCKAVISFSSSDRPAQIEKCEKNKIYYSVATGTLTDTEYEKYKSYEYYVGAIGPDNATEYEAGYNMAKYYISEGKTKFAMFGGAVAYYTEMHIYRAAGMLAAMAETTTDGNYEGATGMGIVGKIYADNCTINTGAVGNCELTAYVGGYDFTDAWFGALGQAANSGCEVCLAVGSGATAWAGFVSGDVTYGDIDAYTSDNAANFASGKLSYMEGKFASCVGPIFVATLNAIDGKAIRNEDGNALALSQGYWEATDKDTFDTYLANSSSSENPAYSKAVLDPYVDNTDYNAFKTFVGKYSYAEIVNLTK